jgi:hypothetical protein
MLAEPFDLKRAHKPGDRYLLVRSCHLGDFLVVAPFLRALTEGLGVPEKDIDLLILNRQRFDPVAALFGQGRFGQVHLASTASLPEYLADAARLRGRLGLSGRRILYLPFWRNSAWELRLKRWLLALPLGLRAVQGMGDGDSPAGDPAANQYFCLQKLYGLPVDESQRGDQRPYLQLSPGEKRKVARFLAERKAGRFSVLYPHSKLAMKVWPAERFKAVARHLLRRGSVVLAGAGEDASYNLRLAQGLGPRVYNAAGLFSVRESIELMGRARLFVGNDGAPMHMAALAGAPVVALFTYKEPVGAWEPWGTPRMVSLRRDVACRECYKAACPYGEPPCLGGVKVEDVLEAITSLGRRGPCSQARVLPAQGVRAAE